ncbi:lysophospholipase [Desulfitobacterium dehalogenans ATCC 51507]|uniref:Lysophospholipase n=2 Tax=Desulfitobacterium dehalogenans TaxID=36854 RepID=I4A4G2_DESDJ|nr:alpha/beta hydrolase [Desulfitobacterium dehalogenans]AFL98846.1 lysophospholipase [Desulfitobacterium dehalogenans ATCC 51507]
MERDYSHIQNREGIRIYYRQMLPPNPKAVVVISHGYAEHSSFYVQFMEFLAEHGYGAYALDHRGHGRSEAERGHLDQFEVFLEDLDVFVDYVQGLHPTLPLFMFGHSMGGLISFNYGILHPEKLQGQVFSGAALDRPAGTETIPAFLFKFLNVVLKWFKIRPKLSGKTTRNMEVRKISDGDPLVLKYATLGFFYQFACRGVAFAQEKADHYRLPCLMLHGTDDQIVSYKVSQRIFPRISSRDKTLKLYEGLYHELIHEPEREEVLADIVGWLDQRVNSGGEVG